jgi:integrase
MGQAYQRGSIRRVKRARGNEVWEWRYRVNGKMKQQTFPAAKYPTEKALWKYLESSLSLLNHGADQALPVAVRMGLLIARYRKEYIPELSSKSARDTYAGCISNYIEPRWEDVAIADVKPKDVDRWLKEQKLSQASKARLRMIIKQLIDKAIFWEMIPTTWPNPIGLVTVKGSTKREKWVVKLKQEQVSKLIVALPEPYSVMVLIAACLGLRIEEIGALQWEDFDLKQYRATLESVAATSKRAAREAQSKWLFPSSRKADETPRWTGVVFQDHIQPVVKKLGLPHIGWHSFRHSYRSWIGSGKATMSEQKDMMRHESIKTTIDTYGGTSVDDMRPHVDAVAAKLRFRPAASQTSSE